LTFGLSFKGAVVFTIQTNIPEIRDRLKRIKLLIDGGWQRDILVVMEDAQTRVMALTPRSDNEQGSQRGGSHVRDGWVMDVIGGSAKGRIPMLVTIYNAFTHLKTGKVRQSARLKYASGEKLDYTVLEILEYGSPAHDINPNLQASWRQKNDEAGLFIPMIRFEVGGEEIFSAGPIKHPGTKAYAMVRLAQAKLDQDLAKFAKEWEKKVANIWSGSKKG
jgi:hypothetical protein